MIHKNRVQINDNWRFRFEDEPTAWVTLPHTWNALDTMEPDPAAKLAHYRRGTGWCEQVEVGGETAVLAAVQLITPDGIPVLTDERRLSFALAGNGNLLTNQGTPTGSRVVQTANGRAAIYIFDADETTTLHVISDKLPPYQLRVV